MKKKMVDPDMPVGKLIRIKDFLPPPHKLIFPTSPVKVTIALSLTSVEFFKYHAKKNHTKYQKMIRAVLDQYVARYPSV